MALSVRHSEKTPQLLKAAIEVHRLRPPAVHRKLPSIIPRRRERPGATQATVDDPSRAEQASPNPLSAASTQFEWPVEGKILAHFGPSGNGERNDGINIGADPGTPIHAAAAGEVTYAGKLKGYGNLILIRHDNGYITAYAHAQALLVSAGDRVDRGDVIGLSGRSGDVDRPQLHFEIRQGTKALDPRPLLLATRES